MCFNDGTVGGVTRSDGFVNEKYHLSFTVVGAAIIGINLRLWPLVGNWDVITTPVLILCILMYFIFSLVYTGINIEIALFIESAQIYWQFFMMCTNPGFWLSIVVTVAILMAPHWYIHTYTVYTILYIILL